MNTDAEDKLVSLDILYDFDVHEQVDDDGLVIRDKEVNVPLDRIVFLQPKERVLAKKNKNRKKSKFGEIMSS